MSNYNPQIQYHIILVLDIVNFAATTSVHLLCKTVNAGLIIEFFYTEVLLLYLNLIIIFFVHVGGMERSGHNT